MSWNDIVCAIRHAGEPKFVEMLAVIAALSSKVNEVPADGVAEVVELLDAAFDALDGVTWPSLEKIGKRLHDDRRELDRKSGL